MLHLTAIFLRFFERLCSSCLLFEFLSASAAQTCYWLSWLQGLGEIGQSGLVILHVVQSHYRYCRNQALLGPLHWL